MSVKPGEGHDGYFPKTGQFFQMYAPLDPGMSLAEAALKAKTDFAGLMKNWAATCPIKEYFFAFNDEYRGSIKPLEGALQDIEKLHGIPARAFLAKHLEEEVMRLPLQDIEEILQTVIPETGVLASASFDAVKEVVEHVLSASKILVPATTFYAPSFDEKLQFNGLGVEVGGLLRNAALQVDAIDEYFTGRSGFHKQALRDQLAARYFEIANPPNKPKPAPDHVFWQLLFAITPTASQMKHAVQQAAIVVLAFYFEACDVFEAPDAAAH